MYEFIQYIIGIRWLTDDSDNEKLIKQRIINYRKADRATLLCEKPITKQLIKNIILYT